MDNRPMFNPDGFRRVARPSHEPPAHRPMFQPPSPQVAKQEPLPQQQPAPVVRHHIPAAHELPKKHHKGGFLKKRWWVILILLILLASTSVLAYAYVDARNEIARLSAQDSNNTGESSGDLVTDISKYLQLPNETPTMATVSDITKLKGQEFFKDAQNGDKVLIFSESGKALLYRPSTKMIIEYAKVDLTNTEQAQP